MDYGKFFIYLLVAALTTYLIRMLPLVLIKKKITNKFIVSFLYYVPYAVLSVMTVPAVFFSCGSVYSASAGVIAGVIAAYYEKSLLQGACLSCLVVFVTECIISII